ncbi:hypothetical protein LTR08_001700 [Meristemomyces frigidus]|nr:hypothetical protein LTR08_001700 [Meristemomyces frigidus]
MASQAQNATKGATDQAPGGLGDKVQGATDGVLKSVEGWGGWIAAKGQALVDKIISPEQRASLLAKLQSFMLKNPKISAFLGMNLALTGIPLGLFALFTLTVALFSLVVGLLLGLLAAVLFILFAVGIALTIVLPAVLFTTMTACFLFLWGLGGYYILKWANGNSEGQSQEGGGSGAIGDKLNALTGGRLTGFMDAAKGERAKGDISGYGDQHNKPNAGEKKPASPQHQSNGTSEKKPAAAPSEKKPAQSNGTPHKDATKEVNGTAHKVTKATGAEGGTKAAGAAKGTATGAVSGVTA